MRRDPRIHLDVYLVEFVGGNRLVFIFDAALFAGILHNSSKLPLARVVDVLSRHPFQASSSPCQHVCIIDGVQPAKVNVVPVGYVAVPLLVTGLEASATAVLVTPPLSVSTIRQLTRL